MTNKMLFFYHNSVPQNCPVYWNNNQLKCLMRNDQHDSQRFGGNKINDFMFCRIIKRKDNKHERENLYIILVYWRLFYDGLYFFLFGGK